MSILRFICWIKTIYYTLRSQWFQEGVVIDGCSFVEQDDKSLKCEICGKISK